MAKRSLATAIVLSLVLLPLTGCQTGIQALTNIPDSRIEELATFTCVTSDMAASIREKAEPSEQRYRRSATLYGSAAGEFNAIIEGIAGNVERGEDVDVASYWNRLGTAQLRQREFVEFAQSQGDFGFAGGINLLIAAAAPYAKKFAQRFVEQKVRSAAAAYLRREFILPAFESAAHCTE